MFALSTAAIILVTCNLVLGSDSSYLLNSDRFPANDEDVPTLSNGNIGFVVHSDHVFMTGVFSGNVDTSARARIPNFANLRIEECDPRAADQPNCAYQLDMRLGRFRTVYEDPGRQLRVVHDIYPHRYIDHALVNRFRLQRLNGGGVVQARIHQTPPVVSPDVNFKPVEEQTILDIPYLSQCGSTNVPEDADLQPRASEVCIFYRNYPTLLELPADSTAQDYFFFATYARSFELARQEAFLMAIVDDPDRLQTVAMDEEWDLWGITVEGNPALDRAIKASAFQLFSNIPSSRQTQAFAYERFGISSSGIGRGNGHVQWDHDMWIFPLITLVEPFKARDMLQYRARITRRGAAQNAERNGFPGRQYPWASGSTGRELAQADIAALRYHVNADVAFAARYFFTAMDDLFWMQTDGCTLAYETAQFWMNHTVFNEATKRFDIFGVTGPDDTYQNVNNNAFTNVVAAHNLYFGEFAGCYCRFDLILRDGDWQQLARRARSIMLPYNATLDFTPQFDGFIAGSTVSQADAVLLGYPLQVSMPDSTKRNNLEIYGRALPVDAPSTTWSAQTIGWLDLDELDRAATDFERSYRRFLREPFNIWNRKPIGAPSGEPNYVTGAAGFLQSILNGYAGIRLHTEQMVIKPKLPPGTTRLFVPQVGYMRASFSLDIRANSFQIIFKRVVTDPQIRIFVDGMEHQKCNDGCVIGGTQNITLMLARANPIIHNCKLQPMEMNMDYDSGSESKKSMVSLTVLLVAFVLKNWL